MRHRLAVSLAVATLAVATGCTRTTDFSVRQSVDVASAGGNVPYTFTRDVDLSQEAGAAWSHRDHVKGLTIGGIDATITAVHAGGSTTGTGSIVLSRNGTDVTIGTWTGVTLPATAPHSVDVTIHPDAASVLLDALRGDGKLAIKATASTAAPISFAADVTLHVGVTYRVP